MSRELEVMPPPRVVGVRLRVVGAIFRVPVSFGEELGVYWSFVFVIFSQNKILREVLAILLKML
jgi:hypothetical protein